MNVLFVSECSKQALVETRRILDQFAERKGRRTWQTPITLEGLSTVRKILRKSARRSTAIACHWLKGGSRTELLWTVGNQRRFNEIAAVPTNSTSRNILRSSPENRWSTGEDIAILAGLAGLFHDFGKANQLFQRKLRPRHSGSKSEPLRHEWISLALFVHFVGEDTDRRWLERLSELAGKDEALFQELCATPPATSKSPFTQLVDRPLAQVVAWLILTHHRLPRFPATRGGPNEPRLRRINDWLLQDLDATWNSPQLANDWPAEAVVAVWRLELGTPLRSQTWLSKARRLAIRGLRSRTLCSRAWGEDLFSSHMARLVLMLSDHQYSSQGVTPVWQDPTYEAYANTDKLTKGLKQRLDEHCIGVSHGAVLIAKCLPTLRDSLPSIGRHRAFKKRSENERFRWQDKAYDLACSVREQSASSGFFGVNMASTGSGKTFANGRIMYGLSNERDGLRMSIALGLRTLTLQTGDALKQMLQLDDDDIAILIGSSAVRQLHARAAAQDSPTGSESEEDLFDENHYVRYDGALRSTRLSEWLSRSPKLSRLVNAPILVCTIDHLIPATEGERGGKQIAPMLRLLTSDLVLDEPDDFDLQDLPALSRLVHWTGMLGAKVLLSSATLPPSLIGALFEAYQTGRQAFVKAQGPANLDANVVCAWFDEEIAIQCRHQDLATFGTSHQAFVAQRSLRLATVPSVRKGQIAPLRPARDAGSNPITVLATDIREAFLKLHHEHAVVNPSIKHRVSIGLVRMANITPLVAVAKELMAMESPSDTHIHYCVYHSQYPLIARSSLEARLDSVLGARDSSASWRCLEEETALAGTDKREHIFVVLATPVAEVGRDHDYDWAVVEPSSMRSLIQISGRVQRHRQRVPSTPNVIILSTNYKGLNQAGVCFHRPGFESERFPLRSHKLSDILEPVQYSVITAAPRIAPREVLDPSGNLADLEHAHMAERLLGPEGSTKGLSAALWWRTQIQWCAELQRRTPFRQSRPEVDYVHLMSDEDADPLFYRVDEQGNLKPASSQIGDISLPIARGVSIWGEASTRTMLLDIAGELGMPFEQASRTFACLTLPEYETTDGGWLHHPAVGVHRAIS